MVIPAGKHHTRHAEFNRKETPRWVPEQRDTGQEHPDKGIGHRSDDSKPSPLLLECPV